MHTRNAIGNLRNRYLAVLRKCSLLNTFGSLAIAGALVLGGGSATSLTSGLTGSLIGDSFDISSFSNNAHATPYEFTDTDKNAIIGTGAGNVGEAVTDTITTGTSATGNYTITINEDQTIGTMSLGNTDQAGDISIKLQENGGTSFTSGLVNLNAGNHDTSYTIQSGLTHIIEPSLNLSAAFVFNTKINSQATLNIEENASLTLKSSSVNELSIESYSGGGVGDSSTRILNLAGNINAQDTTGTTKDLKISDITLNLQDGASLGILNSNASVELAGLILNVEQGSTANIYGNLEATRITSTNINGALNISSSYTSLGENTFGTEESTGSINITGDISINSASVYAPSLNDIFNVDVTANNLNITSASNSASATFNKDLTISDTIAIKAGTNTANLTVAGTLTADNANINIVGGTDQGLATMNVSSGTAENLNITSGYGLNVQNANFTVQDGNFTISNQITLEKHGSSGNATLSINADTIASSVTTQHLSVTKGGTINIGAIHSQKESSLQVTDAYSDGANTAVNIINGGILDISSATLNVYTLDENILLGAYIVNYDAEIIDLEPSTIKFNTLAIASDKIITATGFDQQAVAGSIIFGNNENTLSVNNLSLTDTNAIDLNHANLNIEVQTLSTPDSTLSPSNVNLKSLKFTGGGEINANLNIASGELIVDSTPQNNTTTLAQGNSLNINTINGLNIIEGATLDASKGDLSVIADGFTDGPTTTAGIGTNGTGTLIVQASDIGLSVVDGTVSFEKTQSKILDNYWGDLVVVGLENQKIESALYDALLVDGYFALIQGANGTLELVGVNSVNPSQSLVLSSLLSGSSYPDEIAKIGTGLVSIGGSIRIASVDGQNVTGQNSNNNIVITNNSTLAITGQAISGNLFVNAGKGQIFVQAGVLELGSSGVSSTLNTSITLGNAITNIDNSITKTSGQLSILGDVNMTGHIYSATNSSSNSLTIKGADFQVSELNLGENSSLNILASEANSASLNLGGGSNSSTNINLIGNNTDASNIKNASLNLTAGNGGDGGNGGGTASLNTETLSLNNAAIFNLTAGNGGAGALDKGGNGGNGGNASLNIAESLNLTSSTLNIAGGAGGNGGNGGNAELISSTLSANNATININSNDASANLIVQATYSDDANTIVNINGDNAILDISKTDFSTLESSFKISDKGTLKLGNLTIASNILTGFDGADSGKIAFENYGILSTTSAVFTDTENITLSQNMILETALLETANDINIVFNGSNLTTNTPSSLASSLNSSDSSNQNAQINANIEFNGSSNFTVNTNTLLANDKNIAINSTNSLFIGENKSLDASKGRLSVIDGGFNSSSVGTLIVNNTNIGFDSSNAPEYDASNNLIKDKYTAGLELLFVDPTNNAYSPEMLFTDYEEFLVDGGTSLIEGDKSYLYLNGVKLVGTLPTLSALKKGTYLDFSQGPIDIGAGSISHGGTVVVSAINGDGNTNINIENKSTLKLTGNEKGEIWTNSGANSNILVSNGTLDLGNANSGLSLNVPNPIILGSKTPLGSYTNGTLNINTNANINTIISSQGSTGNKVNFNGGTVTVNNANLNDATTNIASGASVTIKDANFKSSIVNMAGALLNIDELNAGGSIFNVGTELSVSNTRPMLMVKELNSDLTNTTKIVTDPPWVDGIGIEGAAVASYGSFGSTGIAGQIIVGRNSYQVFGTTDNLWAENVFNNSGLTWSRSDVTAALFINSPQSLHSGFGAIEVDGLLTSIPSLSANTANFAGQSLLVVNSDNMANSPALSATNGTLSVANTSKLLITGNGTGNIIIADGFNNANSNLETGAWGYGQLANTYGSYSNILTDSILYLVENVNWDSSLGRFSANIKLNENPLPLVDSSVNKFLVEADKSNLTGVQKQFFDYVTKRDLSTGGALSDAPRVAQGTPQIAAIGAVAKSAINATQLVTGAITARNSISQIGSNAQKAVSVASAENVASEASGIILNPENTMQNGFGAWLMPMYKWSKVSGMKTNGFESGYETGLGGLALGFDYTFNEAYRVGIALNAGAGYVDSNGDFYNTENDFDFFGVSLYGAYQKNNLGITVDFGYTGTHNELDQNMPSGFSQNEVDVDAHVLTAGINAEYKFSTQYLDIIPHAGVRYMNVTVDSHNVENANSTLFNVSKDTQNIWYFPVGVTFTKDIVMQNAWTFTPKLDLGFIAAVGDLDARTRASMPGVNSVIDLAMENVDDLAFNGGIGFDFANDRITLGLNYNILSSGNETGHMVNANFVYKF